MAFKNILVIYYSRSGTTQKVAQEIARRLKCDLREIHSRRQYPMGFWGFQKALLSVLTNARIETSIDSANLRQYDLVIAGGPMWGSAPATPLRCFVEDHRNLIRKFAFFYTQAGTSGGAHFLNDMIEAAGRDPVALLELNVVDLKGDGYQRKIQEFVDSLLPALPDKRPSEAQL